MTHRAIDCLVNVHFGETEKQPTWMLKVRDDYFKGPDSMFAPVDLTELVDEMDEQGVAKAILMDSVAKPSVTARKFVEAKPDRFALAMGGVNLLRPMPSLKELSAVVADLPVAYAVVGPSFWGDGQYPPSDAVYYPLYTKCAELGLPLCVNTGIPGPPIPGEVQNPIHLDRVCVRFPELKLCMIHGADPWWDVAIRLMIKYENLHLMTSAWSPKRLPESLLHYMRTRGSNKVIYASDWPVLKMRRVVPEALALDLPTDVLENYLYNNAHKFFFAAPGGALMDRHELRRLDYSLSEDHVALQAAYKDFFKTRCSIETVWAAEESGFDKSLWERLCAMGATTMALPESVGGDGATLVDLTLVAEEIGRSLAPVPWIDHVCAARLLARLGALDADVMNGKQLAAFDPRHDNVSGVRLIPTGSIADQIVVRDGDDIVRLTFDTRPAKVDNIGRLPMAWVDPAGADGRAVLASGAKALAEYQRALDEWRVLMAAALVGLVEETMMIAAEFAKNRYTLGVPISTLQGISHPLANIAITVQGGRNLARRAAWFLDNEPDERPELAPSAFVFMAEEASKAATMAVHIQGGLGVSAEAAASAYLVRARGWTLAGGDPGASAKYIAEIVAARESR